MFCMAFQGFFSGGGGGLGSLVSHRWLGFISLIHVQPSPWGLWSDAWLLLSYLLFWECWDTDGAGSVTSMINKDGKERCCWKRKRKRRKVKKDGVKERLRGQERGRIYGKNWQWLGKYWQENSNMEEAMFPDT